MPLCTAAGTKTFHKARMGVRQARKCERVTGEGDMLTCEAATLYRATAAVANYLNLDRHGSRFATKELGRGFAVPTMRDDNKLRRLGRYLRGRPGIVGTFGIKDWQTGIDTLTTFTDTDFAECPGKRRSTSGGVRMRPEQCIKT